jgi:hypothetical protein
LLLGPTVTLYSFNKGKIIDDMVVWDSEWHSQVEITNLEGVVDPEIPAVNTLQVAWTWCTIQRYKDTYKDDNAVSENGLSPSPNTVRLNLFDSGASLMSFAESADMQWYKYEVEAVTEKVDNVQAKICAMKAGIDSIQAFMKQLQPAGSVTTPTSRTEPSSLFGNTDNSTRVTGSG